MGIILGGNTLSGTTFNTIGEIANTPNVITDGLVLWIDAGNNYSYINSPNYYDCGYGPQYYSSNPGCTPCNTKIMDMSGFGNDGTLTGAVVTYSNTGGSVYFNGSTDKVTFATSLLTGTGDFTLAAWIKRAVTGSVDFILGNYGSSNSGGIEFYIGSGDKLTTYISGYVASSVAIDTNWHHVATTRISGGIKMYIDGVQDGSGTLSSSIVGNNLFTMGNGYDYTSEAFGGNIAIGQVYNRGLSAIEIIQNFNNGRQRFGI